MLKNKPLHLLTIKNSSEVSETLERSDNLSKLEFFTFDFNSLGKRINLNAPGSTILDLGSINYYQDATNLVTLSSKCSEIPPTVFIIDDRGTKCLSNNKDVYKIFWYALRSILKEDNHEVILLTEKNAIPQYFYKKTSKSISRIQSLVVTTKPDEYFECLF